jgi:hypothetical protein
MTLKLNCLTGKLRESLGHCYGVLGTLPESTMSKLSREEERILWSRIEVYLDSRTFAALALALRTTMHDSLTAQVRSWTIDGDLC